MQKKILMVDDESSVLYTIKNGLESLDNNIKVETVQSGEKCLEALEQEKPDLILLDIMMPDMSGWEVNKKIRSNPNYRDIPIVFLTARTDKMAKNAGGFLGEDYIEKPVDIIHLKKRVDEIIDK
jgi:CheY-like chemotaxis protein